MCGQSEDLIDEVRHVLCQARDAGVKAIGSGGRSLGQQNADDTAIVQSVGAPFAALQWREEDSVNNFRCDIIKYGFAENGVAPRRDRRTQRGIEYIPRRVVTAVAINDPHIKSQSLDVRRARRVHLTLSKMCVKPLLICIAGQRQTEAFSRIVRKVSTVLDPCCETIRDPKRDFSNTRNVLCRTSGTPLNTVLASCKAA